MHLHGVSSLASPCTVRGSARLWADPGSRAHPTPSFNSTLQPRTTYPFITPTHDPRPAPTTRTHPLPHHRSICSRWSIDPLTAAELMARTREYHDPRELVEYKKQVSNAGVNLVRTGGRGGGTHCVSEGTHAQGSIEPPVSNTVF